MRRLLLSVVLVTAACSGSTSTAPSGTTGSASTSTPAPSGTTNPPSVGPAPATTPQYQLTGPADARSCVAAGRDAMRWVLDVSDAGPSPLRFVAAVDHDDAPGCAAADNGSRTQLSVDGAANYAAHASGQTRFMFDPANFTCGRAEFDVAMLDGEGRQTSLLAVVVDFGRACTAAPPAPTPTPTPAPTPAPPTPVTPLTCGPPSQTIFGPNPTATVNATGGTGTYAWSAPGANTTTGSGSRFTTTYPVTGMSSFGDKTITVTSGSQTATCRVNVAAVL